MNSHFYTPNIIKKSKKYYKYEVEKHDKENIFQGNKLQILKQLSQKINTEMNDSLMLLQQHKITSKIRNRSRYDSCYISQNKISTRNQTNFYKKASKTNQNYQQQVKQLKKELLQHLSLFEHTQKVQRNLYKQFIDLAKQSGQYLDFYQKTYMQSQDSIQKQINKISKILLCVLNNSFKSFSLNSCEILNRVYLSFDLNPMNEFNFVDWQKFSKIRKIMSAEASRVDVNQFLCRYFLFKASSIARQELWIIFSSVFKKLSKKLGPQVFNKLTNRLKVVFQKEIKLQKIDKESFRIYLISNPFIWDQFVKMIFCYS